MMPRIAPAGPSQARMISYAQNAEDVVLARAFREQNTGFYVDLGASDPVRDSVTNHFYLAGWTGINVEPRPAAHSALVAARPADTNLNVAIGDRPGILTFHHFPSAPERSTFSANDLQWAQAEGFVAEGFEVPVITLNALFEDYASGRTVDFLKVDIEGYEPQALEPFEWLIWRPRAVVVEVRPSVDARPTVEPWESRLLDHGYEFMRWDGINKYFARSGESEQVKSDLRMPAVPAIDRYDPWMYVEQAHRYDDQALTYRQLIELYEPYFSARIGGGSDHMSAMRALAATLARRPDVVAEFGLPPGLDERGLLGWAAKAGLRDEPFTAALLVHAAVYESLAVG